MRIYLGHWAAIWILLLTLLSQAFPVYEDVEVYSGSKSTDVQLVRRAGDDEQPGSSKDDGILKVTLGTKSFTLDVNRELLGSEDDPVQDAVKKSEEAALSEKKATAEDIEKDRKKAISIQIPGSKYPEMLNIQTQQVDTSKIENVYDLYPNILHPLLVPEDKGKITLDQLDQPDTIGDYRKSWVQTEHTIEGQMIKNVLNRMLSDDSRPIKERQLLFKLLFKDYNPNFAKDYAAGKIDPTAEQDYSSDKWNRAPIQDFSLILGSTDPEKQKYLAIVSAELNNLKGVLERGGQVQLTKQVPVDDKGNIIAKVKSSGGEKQKTKIVTKTLSEALDTVRLIRLVDEYLKVEGVRNGKKQGAVDFISKGRALDSGIRQRIANRVADDIDIGNMGVSDKESDKEEDKTPKKAAPSHGLRNRRPVNVLNHPENNLDDTIGPATPENTNKKGKKPAAKVTPFKLRPFKGEAEKQENKASQSGGRGIPAASVVWGTVGDGELRDVGFQAAIREGLVKHHEKAKTATQASLTSHLDFLRSNEKKLVGEDKQRYKMLKNTKFDAWDLLIDDIKKIELPTETDRTATGAGSALDPDDKDDKGKGNEIVTDTTIEKKDPPVEQTPEEKAAAEAEKERILLLEKQREETAKKNAKATEERNRRGRKKGFGLRKRSFLMNFKNSYIMEF